MCRPELHQAVDVAVADDRLAVLLGPALGAAIEIDRACVHRVALDDVEEIRVALERAAQARGARKIRVRRDDEAATPPFEPREIRERRDVLGAVAEIQQQHVAAFDRPLDAWHEHDAAFGGVRGERPDVELLLVQRDREPLVAQRGGAVD